MIIIKSIILFFFKGELIFPLKKTKKNIKILHAILSRIDRQIHIVRVAK